MFKDTNEGKTHFVGDDCNPPHEPIESASNESPHDDVDREFDERFPYGVMAGHDGDLDITDDLKSFIRAEKAKSKEEGAREEREKQGYVIHEVHGEGGKTINGEKLYWAKVRKSNLTPRR